MLVASLVVSVLASIGGDTNFYQTESWKAPTMGELQTCADMAHSLNVGFDYQIRQGLNKDWQSKTATCELVNVGDDDDDKAPVATNAAFKF
ncbi:hypothetical protein HOV23_gp125 [Pseudomonas phage Lana]|uniref:Uncharacterized protein n=1 Tax=Pseudomonas phage Lana TaxID=2530172 RepID=A0A481W738_9CAUD|nr:hypothetical protein HOV23_gp125 [Pseudomonas phage Lana]QBJ04448.1 hypothetical protein [Pseudomonas phage Lana]